MDKTHRTNTNQSYFVSFRNVLRYLWVIITVTYHAEHRLLYENQDQQGAEGERGAVLTVNNDLDHPEVNFSPGHDTSLAVVHSLIRLLDAADLQVAIIHDLVSHLNRKGKQEFRELTTVGAPD